MFLHKLFIFYIDNLKKCRYKLMYSRNSKCLIRTMVLNQLFAIIIYLNVSKRSINNKMTLFVVICFIQTNLDISIKV
ncbi:MAG: hypothetical protein A2Y34_07410 [Spirochaetes bacterium GWC1_27_15]|nr:MAG: hypothetical protein A2Y34_07410 [Spirochaetes bacterium GWC1_27_15]